MKWYWTLTLVVVGVIVAGIVVSQARKTTLGAKIVG